MLRSDNMMFLKQSESHTHGDCANFRNGFCTLNNVAVDPDESACPNFIPKDITPRMEIRYNYPYQHTQFPQTRYGSRAHHSSCFPSSLPTATGRGDAVLLLMLSGRRGGSRYVGGSRGRGKGRMGRFAAGPGGSCVCPRCGYSTSHAIGTPCYQQTCPKCGSRMTRGS